MLRIGTNCERAYVTQLSPRASALRPNWMHGQKKERRPTKLKNRIKNITLLFTGGTVTKATEDSVTPFSGHCCYLIAVLSNCSNVCRLKSTIITPNDFPAVATIISNTNFGNN